MNTKHDPNVVAALSSVLTLSKAQAVIITTIAADGSVHSVGGHHKWADELLQPLVNACDRAAKSKLANAALAATAKN